jgi:uncharacterized phiE125 gp8 family phage protein
MINPEVRFNTEGTEAITVKNLKDWGKVPGDADDQVIDDMIKAVRQLQEEWTLRSFIEKTITANWTAMGYERSIELPYGPIRSIESIKRVYSDGTLSAALVEGTDYFITGMDFQVINLYTRWKSTGQIQTGMRVAYTTGHGTEEGESWVALPAPLRQCMLRQVITDYDMRDDLEVYNPVLYDWTKEALQPYKRRTWL